MIRIVFTVLMIFFSNNLHAEVVKEITINGNVRVSSETVKVYGDIDINKDYTKNDLDEILKKLYATNFFESINLSLDNGILRIDLKEYQVINEIIIEGEETNKFKTEILRLINSKNKNSFIENLVIEDEVIIKKFYQNLGFNFAEISTKIENFDKDRVNLYFLITKNNKTKISEINFIGDKKVRDTKLRDIIVSEEHKFWKFISNNVYLNLDNIELDKRLLTNYLRSIGYYEAQVISSYTEVNKEGYTILNYNISSGDRYKISKISTDLDPSISKNVFSEMQNVYQDYIGKYYSPFSISKILEEIDEVIVDNDLQFVEHSVSEKLSSNSVEITFNIFEGEKVLVERIDINGNRITNEDVIRSELIIDEGDPFNKTNLAKSISRLKARNIFGKVEETVENGSSDDLKIITINVEEQATGEISAGAGIGTDGGAFDFSIKENNWMGKGMQLSSFLSLREKSLKGSIELNDPNYKFSGNSRFYNISSITNNAVDSGYKNSLVTLGIGTRYEQYKNLYFAPAIYLTSDKLDVESSASTNLKKQEGTFNDLTFNYSLTSDERDRAYATTDGYIAGFEQSLPLYADAPYIKNTIYRNNYYSFTDNVITAVKFYAQAVNGIGEDVRLSKRADIPSSRIRGFESGKIGPKDGGDFIGGNYAAALNFETSLPNLFPESSNLDLNLFLDFANVWGVDYDSSIDESNELRSSTGIAIDFRSPIGPMSFIFAQDLSKADTDKTESFNFRLGATF